MENRDLIKTIIKTAVERGLKYIKEQPKRGTRNLLDLGEFFATGRFQKDFFGIANEILKNEDSPYFELIENIVDNTDHDLLTNFGINLGYNSFTYGAEKIREYKKNNRCNVPWTIIFNFENPQKNQLTSDEIAGLIKNGKEIGIYSYMFMIKNNETILEPILKVMDKYKDCAFLLFLNSNLITKELTEETKRLKNTLLFINIFEENCKYSKNSLLDAIKLLRSKKCLFGLYKYYDDESVDSILNGEVTEEIMKLSCSYAMLIKGGNCSETNEESVYKSIKNSRTNMKLPVFLIDFYNDIAHINQNISDESCFLSINSCGQASVSNLNIRSDSLEKILYNCKK